MDTMRDEDYFNLTTMYRVEIIPDDSIRKPQVYQFRAFTPWTALSHAVKIAERRGIKVKTATIVDSWEVT